jgi:hypothetical protein
MRLPPFVGVKLGRTATGVKTAFDCFWLYGLACTRVPLPDRRMCAPLNFLTPVRKCL